MTNGEIREYDLKELIKDKKPDLRAYSEKMANYNPYRILKVDFMSTLN